MHYDDIRLGSQHITSHHFVTLFHSPSHHFLYYFIPFTPRFSPYTFRALSPQTVLKTLKTHKLSDTAVENACWVLGNVVAALPLSKTSSSYAWSVSERGSSPTTVGTALPQAAGAGFDTISLEDSPTSTTANNNNSTVDDDPFNPVSLPFTSSSSSSSSSPLQSLRDAVYQDPHNWDLLVGCVETHMHKEQAVRWLAAAVGVFADQGKRRHVTPSFPPTLHASCLYADISTLLPSYLPSWPL